MKCQSIYMIKSARFTQSATQRLHLFVYAIKQARRNHFVFPSSSANFLFRGLLSRPWRKSTIKKMMLNYKGTAANCVAIASAVIVRFRNTKALALHYRISTVLSKLTTSKSSFHEKVKAF